jgi:hypothetical protein
MAIVYLPVLFCKTLISLHDDDRRTDTSISHAFVVVLCEGLGEEREYQIGSKIDYTHAREQIET